MFRIRLAGKDFESWRDAARPFVLAGVAPEAIDWSTDSPAAELFGDDADAVPPHPQGVQFAVPRAFIDLARLAIASDDPDRFALLYALLFRVAHDRHAITDWSDPLLVRVNAVAREVNMAKARKGKNSIAAWEAIRDAAKACTRCDLHKHANQMVFGEGPVDSKLMLVGEQPGDQEDLQGHPFVGPAGQLLDRALGEAGIDRAKIYLSNAVKHFKFEPRGKRRIHSKPDTGEITACRWWIDQERAVVQPPVVVALGATAAQSLLNRAVTISRTRGTPVPLEDGSMCHVTVHPSYLLRIPDEARVKEEFRAFVEDLVRAKDAAGE